MPKLRTEISKGPFPLGNECECATCGVRFLNLAGFDGHLDECAVADGPGNVTASFVSTPGTDIATIAQMASKGAGHGALRNDARAEKVAEQVRRTLRRRIACEHADTHRRADGRCKRCQADAARAYRQRRSG